MNSNGLLDIKVKCFSKDSSSDWIKITISDQGAGIPQFNKIKVFEPFFTTKGNHMGYGLWRTKHIIEGIGGDIFFESQDGIGTTFTINLPVNLE